MKKYKASSGNSADRRKRARAISRRGVKSVMEDKECGNGVWWCNYIYDPMYPWVWTDFRFLSLKNPKKYYYAVAMQTLEYSELGKDDDRAWKDCDEKFGAQDFNEELFEKLPDRRGYKLKENADFEMRLQFRKERSAIYNKEARLAKPYIDVKVEEYRPGVIGIWCTVNKPHIDDQVISEFIEHFRSIGEPNEEGIVWTGEEVEVIPNKINERYPTSV